MDGKEAKKRGQPLQLFATEDNNATPVYNVSNA